MIEIDVKKELLDINGSLNQAFAQLNLIVLENPKFYIWPASPKNHHSFELGLALHTLEVTSLCNDICKKNPKLKRDILLTGAIWHDIGKLTDYAINSQGVWDYSSNRKTIGHIASGYAEFIRTVHQIFPNTIRPHEIEEIGHLILSHHGQLSYGSPVTPQSKEAWTLHLMDMTSAFIFGKP